MNKDCLLHLVWCPSSRRYRTCGDNVLLCFLPDITQRTLTSCNGTCSSKWHLELTTLRLTWPSLNCEWTPLTAMASNCQMHVSKSAWSRSVCGPADTHISKRQSCICLNTEIFLAAGNTVCLVRESQKEMQFSGTPLCLLLLFDCPSSSPAPSQLTSNLSAFLHCELTVYPSNSVPLSSVTSSTRRDMVFRWWHWLCWRQWCSYQRTTLRWSATSFPLAGYVCVPHTQVVNCGLCSVCVCSL